MKTNIKLNYEEISKLVNMLDEEELIILKEVLAEKELEDREEINEIEKETLPYEWMIFGETSRGVTKTK